MFMYFTIRGQNMTAHQRVVIFLPPGNQTARLAQDHYAGGDIIDVQIELKKALAAAAGDAAQVVGS